MPALRAIRYTREIGRISTVKLARDWVVDNVPQGAKVTIETRALLLDPLRYQVSNIPQLIADPLSRAPREYDTYAAEGVDYIIASGQSFGPIMASPRNFPDEYRRYMQLFERSHEIARFPPNAQHPGPELRVYKLK
jgi:hypothetical protein